MVNNQSLIANLESNTDVVINDDYEQLQALISATCAIPDNLFADQDEHNKNCYFLFDYETCRFLFTDTCYELFTGFSPKNHQEGGLDFWFSKVHPDDRKMLGDRIVESMKISKHPFENT